MLFSLFAAMGKTEVEETGLSVTHLSRSSLGFVSRLAEGDTV